jgi:hypothetical protein
MVATWRLAAGAAAVVLGLAWVATPVRMSRLQSKVLYLGRGKEIEGTEREATYGRVSGVILAVLGVVLALGVEV